MTIAVNRWFIKQRARAASSLSLAIGTQVHAVCVCLCVCTYIHTYIHTTARSASSLSLAVLFLFLIPEIQNRRCRLQPASPRLWSGWGGARPCFLPVRACFLLLQLWSSRCGVPMCVRECVCVCVYAPVCLSVSPYVSICIQCQRAVYASDLHPFRFPADAADLRSA